ELPPELASRLAAGLDREDVPALPSPRTRRWAVAATALAASLLAAVLLLRGREPDVVEVVTRDFRTQSATLPAAALRTRHVRPLDRFLRAAILPVPVRWLSRGM